MDAQAEAGVGAEGDFVPVSQQLGEALLAKMTRGAMGALSEEATPGPTEIVGGESSELREEADWVHDRALRTRFYYNHQMKADHVRIEIPVDERTVIDRAATEYDKRRFAAQWNAYVEQRDQHGDETPLTDALWMDAGMVPGLERSRVYTVEQLAAMPDGALKPGYRKLRQRAREELETLERERGLREQSREMEARFAEQAAEIEALRAQVAAQGESPAKQRGRKAA